MHGGLAAAKDESVQVFLTLILKITNLKNRVLKKMVKNFLKSKKKRGIPSSV